MTGTKGLSGGAKPGAGQKPKKKTYSDKVKNSYLKAARKLKKEMGIPLEEAILRMIYDPDVQDTVKVATMKLYNEALLIKDTESTVNKVNAPAVYLPERKPDPAKLIPINKESNVD